MLCDRALGNGPGGLTVTCYLEVLVGVRRLLRKSGVDLHSPFLFTSYIACILFVVSRGLAVHDSMSNITVEIVTPQGWVHSPSGRGTIDIIYSCLATIFLCVWSVLCITIRESTAPQILYKCKIALLCIIRPDFLLYLAIG